MCKIIDPKDSLVFKEYLYLRWLLLRRPLGGKRGTEVDGLEEQSFHRAMIDKNNNVAVGLSSYLRINPIEGVIEVGHIHYSPLIQKKRIGTEAMYLMMKRVFDELGYRRYEWKCDSLNKASCKAAKRIGFNFEGILKQATIYKGRNRNTAWFAIIDKDWPKVKSSFENWLDDNNFNKDGSQKVSLKTLM